MHSRNQHQKTSLINKIHNNAHLSLLTKPTKPIKMIMNKSEKDNMTNKIGLVKKKLYNCRNLIRKLHCQNSTVALCIHLSMI